MYDASKDKVLEKQVACESDKDQLEVSICQYGGGEKKIQINRLVFNKKDGAYVHAKLGRLTFDEWEAVSKAVNSLIEQSKAS
jgi:hypothetical protein